MAAAASTYVLPETVTMPGEAALEALAVLGAFVDVFAEIAAGDDVTDELYRLEDAADRALQNALGYDGDTPPYYEAMRDRSKAIARDLRRLIRGNDALRLAVLEEAVRALGQEVVGVTWDGDARKWLDPSEFVASVGRMTIGVAAERQARELAKRKP